MILERRLAPFYRGEEEPADDDREECPICMLYFPGGLNRSACCQQGLCSECFLQICPRANKPVRCGLHRAPFLDSAVRATLSPDEDALQYRATRSLYFLLSRLLCAQLPLLQGEQLFDHVQRADVRVRA